MQSEWGLHSLDYKQVLLQDISYNKHRTGYQTKLSLAAGCHKSFFSQVIRSHVHLTLDHAAGLCSFWKLPEAQTDYFLDMVMYARASSPHLKKILKNRLQKNYNEQNPAFYRLKHRTLLDEKQQALFFSKWHYTAIYLLLGNPKFPTPLTIAERLNMKLTTVEMAIEQLKEIGMLREKNNQYEKRYNDFAVNNSLYRHSHLQSWRRLAGRRIEEDTPGSLFFSTLYTLTKEDALEIHRILLETLERTRKVALASKQEDELVCLNLDFFSV